MDYLFSIVWNSIRLGGPAHGIVTKTVHKTLPEGGAGPRVGGYRVTGGDGDPGGGVGIGLHGVVGAQGWG